MKRFTLLAAGALLAAACTTPQAMEGPEEAQAEAPNPFAPVPLAAGPWDLETEKGPIHVEVLSRELERPWAIAFLPDGDMLVTERPGRLRLLRGGVLDPRPIEGLPPVYNAGIAGLMDIELHPRFEENRLIYLTYSKFDPENPQDTTLALLRARWDGGYQLSDVEDIFVASSWYGKPPMPEKCCGQGPPFGSYGGRIAFDSEGYLFLTSGDRNFGENVQDPATHFGKIFRLKDDGSVPAGNPFADREGWLPEIWTTGHRNPTGLAFDEQTGRLWSTEFGPRGGDEANLIEPGRNYGWMDVTQGHHYDGTPAKGVKGVEGMTDPVIVWGPPSHNPGNLAVYRGSAFPAWDGDLLIAMMNKTLVRAEIDAQGRLVHEEAMLGELAQRLRDASVGPDGNLYLLTDETEGALLKVTPGDGK